MYRTFACCKGLSVPVVYSAADNEFAAASGSNVNVDPTYSYFDHPPNSTNNLTISSNKGDDDASLFELGDAYDLAWTGNGGGSMDDAVVIRSDILGPGQGAVVFEGINSATGELYQVVWTPGFDLESWYWANGGGPSSPNAFWTSDQDASSTVQYVCFVKGTRLRTISGFRKVENLRVADLLQTRNHGFQPIHWIGQSTVVGRGSNAPVIFAPGALGNRKALGLSQNHRVMLSSPRAARRHGNRNVFVPAKALINNQSIRLVQQTSVTYFHVLLARHEVLDAEDVPCESLLLGKVAVDRLSSDAEGRLALAAARESSAKPMRCARPDLTYQEARQLGVVTGIVPDTLEKAPPQTLIPAMA